jgi:DNA-binding MarR family transcriptional regulator
MTALAASEIRPAPPSDVARLAELVHEVMQATLRRLHPVLAEEGVSMGQFWALHVVSGLATSSMSTVARTLGVSPPTVCASIDQLEAAGLVRRRRSARDRRAVELSLTPRGRRVESRLWDRIGREMTAAARGVPARDVAAAVRVFREVGDRLGSSAPLPEAS